VPGAGTPDHLAQARARLGATLADHGISGAVVDAMCRVRREHFVPAFWAWDDQGELTQFSVDKHGHDLGFAARVYEPHRALPLAPFDRHAPITATASAPDLVALMLDHLELRPGLRVLEIGTGSGYNAALIAELVGDPGLVTTIDIDARLTAEACARLDEAGYHAVAVLTADGYLGAPERAPFDRVVATVGCVDLAPSWLEQLAPGGFAVVPVLHGRVHPLQRVTLDDAAGATSRVVGPSGFVAVQGQQAAADSPWPKAAAARSEHKPEVESKPLPDDIADAAADKRAWHFGYYLALADRRVVDLAALAGDGSAAWVPAAKGEVRWSGPAGEGLADDLLAHVRDWLALGRPAMADYRSTWVRRPTDAEARWIVDRVDYRQLIELG
jgi:protein-L-isoaspartate(D-aspartate) O-methyltransferase